LGCLTTACLPQAGRSFLRSHQQGVPFFPNLTPAMASLPPCSATVPRFAAARVRRFPPLPASSHAALNATDIYKPMYTAPVESSQEGPPVIGCATRQLQNAVAAAHAAFYRTFRPFRASDFDLLQLLLRMNEPRESVTHKICYTDGSGKKHCI